jgi:uncharacterized protein YidB (DUF937 family)
LLDIFQGMSNGAHGQATSPSQGGGMSPITLRLLGLLAYPTFKKKAHSMPNPPTVLSGSGSGLLAWLGGALSAGAGGQILSGGLQELINRLAQNGHGGMASSWVGNGPNQPIFAADLEKVAGSETLEALARELGISHSALLDRLTKELPQTVDPLTPQGRVPTEQDASDILWIILIGFTSGLIARVAAPGGQQLHPHDHPWNRGRFCRDLHRSGDWMVPDRSGRRSLQSNGGRGGGAIRLAPSGRQSRDSRSGRALLRRFPRRHPARVGAATSGLWSARMAIEFAEEIRTQGGIVRSARTIEQALRLIDEDLPLELRNLPRWTFARALLLEAQRTGAKKDVRNALRQLKQALSNEKWLAA